MTERSQSSSQSSDKASIWVTGKTRSGKTDQLISTLVQWHEHMHAGAPYSISDNRIMSETPAIKSFMSRGFLVFAANGDNRIELAERIEQQTGGRSPFDSTTPFGFFQSEITLFWPLIAEKLQLRIPFPLKLRPETEQLLATNLWQERIDSGILAIDGLSDYYVIRRVLDLFQLAASAGIELEDIPFLLGEGFGTERSDLWGIIEDSLCTWRSWCLAKGLLTYGLIADLYHSVLLPHPTYQEQIARRYCGVLADDVDEYPAIAHDLFTVCLQHGLPGVFTFNPDGSMRLGFGADPDCLKALSEQCQVKSIMPESGNSVGADWGLPVWSIVNNPLETIEIPPCIQTIQTTSRSELLRLMGEVISEAIQTGQATPQDIAVIGPGLDPIARYTLRKILNFRNIAVAVLNDQQPLASSPMICALMTLMAMIYPGLGRLIDRDAIAEMLVALGQQPSMMLSTQTRTEFSIDPVRAGIITDYCFKPDPIHPELLPVTTYERWDRLGHRATERYHMIIQWIHNQQQQQQQRSLTSPVVLLDRAIQSFWFGGSHLPYDQLAALRELMETAQHYWNVEARLHHTRRSEITITESVASFIQLLRDGTITADPYPVHPFGGDRQSVTFSTLFQYRANRKTHRWHFWLDAGSPLWLTGGSPLFGAHLFLRHRRNQLWTAVEKHQENHDRLRRNILDLTNRATERIFLCHSDLATSGQEQDGPLIPLVNLTRSINDEV